MAHITVGRCKFIACDCLHKCFEGSNKTNVSFSCNNATVLLNFKRIILLTVSEYTFEFSIFNSDSYFITKAFSLEIGHFIRHYKVRVAPECFFLLVRDQLCDVTIIFALFKIF